MPLWCCQRLFEDKIKLCLSTRCRMCYTCRPTLLSMCLFDSLFRIFVWQIHTVRIQQILLHFRSIFECRLSTAGSGNRFIHLFRLTIIAMSLKQASLNIETTCSGLGNAMLIQIQIQ